MRVVILLAFLFSLNACAQFQQQATQERIQERSAAECPIEQKGNMASLVRCRRDITISEMPNDLGLPVYIKMSNEFIKTAELYDAGKISKKQYDAIESDKRAELSSYIAQINQNHAQQQQKILQDNIYRQQQLDLQRQQMNNDFIARTSIPPKTSSSTDCHAIGNRVHCDTY